MLNLLTPIQETKAYQSILAEGEIEGKIEGKAESLKRLLARRYGPVPAWAEQRIDAATVAQLDGWLDGIFDAANVEDLIGPASGSGVDWRDPARGLNDSDVRLPPESANGKSQDLIII